MKNFPPAIEIMPNHESAPLLLYKKPWYRSPRFLIFFFTLLISASGSLWFNYQRPAIYLSSATLLTSAMTAIDENSVADPQHVAIQKQILLSHELLAETILELDQTSHHHYQLSLTDAQNLLTVNPLTETNLVEIQAEGPDPDLLPLLINTWIDVYLEARLNEVKKVTDETTSIIEDEIKGLEEKIFAKRTQLEQFRQTHEILSTGRDENEALARLKGITDSLNKANEQSLKAKSNLDAVKQAIAEGQPVVPEQEQAVVQNLEKRRQELKEKQLKNEKQFTQDYIKLQPNLKIIPEEIEKIELEIINKLENGKDFVRAEAEKEYAAAQQTVRATKTQLEQHKKEVAEFTTQFANHETLKADLESLEKLHRDTQDRLVQIQTNHKEKYPQVTVLNRAYQPEFPVSPNYKRDALIALLGSLLLSLFNVWVVDFLKTKEESPAPASVTLSGIHMYQNPTAEQLALQQNQIAIEQQQPQSRISAPLTRELSEPELQMLLAASNTKAKQYICCLLSGLTPAEITALKTEQFDFANNSIIVNSTTGRVATLHKPLKNLLLQTAGKLSWDSMGQDTCDELDAALLCAALDSGLTEPDTINAESVRHSYIVYLVKQGLRLSDLEFIVGHLEPAQLLGYIVYTPSQRGRTITEISILHPALESIA